MNSNFNKVIDRYSTSENEMTVECNIGFFTTGKDWWQVTWITENGKGYITTPQNFRNIIDKLEIGLTKGAVGTTAAVTGGPIGSAANIAIGVALNLMMNSEGTDGFKQHILREKDTYNNFIILKDDGVTFQSNSGISDTINELLNKPIAFSIVL